MSSLLQLLGLLNSASVDLSVSAGSDVYWQLSSYRPSKKQGGVSFCVGALAQRTPHGFELTDVLNSGCGSDQVLQGHQALQPKGKDSQVAGHSLIKGSQSSSTDAWNLLGGCLILGLQIIGRA